MENQINYTQNYSQHMVMEQAKHADAVIKQACAWADEAQEFEQQAQSKFEAAKKEKKNKRVFRVTAPFAALYMGIIFSNLVLPLISIAPNSAIAIIFTLLIGIGGTVVLWRVPFKMDQYQAEGEEYLRLAKEKSHDVSVLLEDYSETLSVIPSQYWYPLATNYIVEVLQTGRAATLPAALDKLEEQIHRWNMEAAMQESLSYQMAQTEVLKQVQANSAVSAAANTVSAVANIANLLR